MRKRGEFGITQSNRLLPWLSPYQLKAGYRVVAGGPEEQLVSNATPTGCPPRVRFQGTEMSGI